MTSNLALKVGRSLFEKHLDNYTPTDPLYETYVDKKGKERRRRVRALCFIWGCYLSDEVSNRESSRLACRNAMRRF